MKKYFIGLCLVLISTSIFAKSQEFFGSTQLNNSSYQNVSIYGPAKLSDVRFDNLTVTGPLSFNKIEVLKTAEIAGPVTSSESGKFSKLKITGPLQANKILADNLQVIGPVQVTEVNIKGDTIVYGPLTAEKAHFQNLTILGKETHLKDVVVNNIYIKKDDSNHQQQLTLAGNTQVNGHIIFESGKGSVKIEGQNVILKGEVRGAIVQK